MGMEQKNVRLIAFRVLNRVIYEGAYPDLTLESEIGKNPGVSRRDAALLAEIVYGVIRWLGKLDYVIGLFIRRKVGKKEIVNILRMGVYQILFLDGISDYAAAHETVEIAKTVYGQKVGDFANAIFRETARSRDKIEYPVKEKDWMHYIEVNYSFPKWIVEKWRNAFGTDYTERLCGSLNEIPPLTIRVNTLKTTRELFIAELNDKNIQAAATLHSPTGVNVLTRADPASLPGFKSGLFTVQDEAAQLVSYLLSPKPGDKVLDACCAPGGKTTHIAELMSNNGEIAALDINESRLGLVEKLAENLEINIVRTIQGDASLYGSKMSRGVSLKEHGFDKILVDAPCSGLGTLRRNPDAKWKKTAANVLELSDIQFRILSGISKALKPGGAMVYAVCTLTPEENEKVCEKFLSQNPDFGIDADIGSASVDGFSFFNADGFFITDPVKHNMDGFFAAKFRKKNI